MPHRGENSERQGDHESDGHRRRREEEGRRDPSQDLAQHRLPGPEGRSQIPRRCPQEVLPVLDGEGPVEPELPAQLRLPCGDGALSQHDLDGIAGDQVDEEEDDGYRAEHDEERPAQAGKEVVLHGVAGGLGRMAISLTEE
jgi:hypothetical protein